VPPEAQREEAAALFSTTATPSPPPSTVGPASSPSAPAPLMDHLTERARSLGLTYLASEREEVLCDLACLLAVLAMNHAHTGAYVRGT